jgi:hypothetical protein
MRIGFCSIFSWRPHTEHLYYLSMLARQAGHETFFLTCDADLPSCYGRELRPARAAWRHCTSCRIGGIRSYTSANVDAIGTLARDSTYRSAHLTDWSHSSAGTLGRFESAEDFAGGDFTILVQRLEPAARRTYMAARRWIERHQLDAVVVFNGRMDATRGVFEAAVAAGARCISLERTWFGDGLQLLPDENCLGLRAIDRMMDEWRDVPLQRGQALRAVSHVAARFLRRNTKEWRAYNTGASATSWPTAGGKRRVLLTPSSRNEVWGHPDWALQWPDLTAAFDALMDQFDLRGADVILRCHPNWGERIGARDGALSERHFTDWARRRDVHVIASTDTTSTLGLIEQADAVVVCGGSAALEAGILGKQVIALGPSIYQCAGFQSSAYGSAQLQKLRLLVDADAPQQAAEAAHIERQTLRFCHTMVYRVPQFVRFVRSLTTTRYEYFEGADPARLTGLVCNGLLEADDPGRAVDERGENEVLGLVRERAWDKLVDGSPPIRPGPKRPVKRRWMYRPIDKLRDALPRGDL